jgi:hypothetical protein
MRRLNAMRFGYAFLGLGLAIVRWPVLIQDARFLPVMEGVVTARRPPGHRPRPFRHHRPPRNRGPRPRSRALLTHPARITDRAVGKVQRERAVYALTVWDRSLRLSAVEQACRRGAGAPIGC